MIMFTTFTSAEGADVVDVLTTHTALSLLLEGLFLKDVGLSLPPLQTYTIKRKNEIQTQSDTGPEVVMRSAEPPTLRKTARILV